MRGINVVASTFGATQEMTMAVSSNEAVVQSGSYEETEAWSVKYPDADLPDFSGINKDAYGNYIITEEMFEDDNLLPLNESGYIEYIYYYSEDGTLLNPMSELYNNYLDYFEQNGG